LDQQQQAVAYSFQLPGAVEPLSQSSEFCGHKPPRLLLCVLSAILDFIMDGLKEQRTCIIHHFKLGERHRKRMETAINVFGRNAE
jgi:hypothetical protein